MKSIISVGLLIGSFGYAQLTLADCNYPKMNFVIPNGATASKEEMLATSTKIKAYQADLGNYRFCLDEELSKFSPELENYARIYEISTGRHNGSVDAEEKVADAWKEEIKAYKKANKGK